ncbi:hypothetical protein TNCT_648771 [Trichonephila clavata]|uniref:Uncharacterized protein n=1 Tax=Trichonephila clavata TaxID=2740835 RepID=A0A8X6M0Y8_TRICU|nr:hypothetical protein TNCT_648771 [Trichonephila clavata]
MCVRCTRENTENNHQGLLVNKFKLTCNVANGKRPGRPSTSDNTINRPYLNSFKGSLTLALVVADFRISAGTSDTHLHMFNPLVY